MLISLVSVCLNSEKTIQRTIESVLNQTYGDIEYWIIDGVSHDRTVQIAENYRDAFAQKRISYHIVSEKDNGIYDAMNKGIQYANGSFIALINSSDWYEPNAVETVVKTYAQEPFDIFFADVRLHGSNGRTIVKHSRRDKHIVTSRHWNHMTCFISKDIYLTNQYRCQGIHDDFELYLRIRKLGKKIVVRNVTIANFSTGGISNEKSLRKCAIRCMERYHAYRVNGYSRLYFLECVGIEIAKAIFS